MIELDNDLQSRQNARELVRNAKKAQAMLATFSQQQIDAIVKNVAQEAAHHAEALAKMAAEETGFGNWQDKVLKNRFASLRVYDAIKDMKTVGIIHDDPVKKVMDVGVPLGVICALVPSTNPTSTVIYKALIALKAGNAIIFSPHPGARQCSWKAIEIVKRAAEAAGAPAGSVDGITQLTLEATSELMHSKDVSLILATGGEGMVRAAYASGTPTISGGPGNGPAFIERSADIHHAVKDIITSKTFDNGVICASEQSIIVEGCIYDEVRDYCLMGCVEPQKSGRIYQWTSTGYTQWPIAIEFVLNRGRMVLFDSYQGLDTGDLRDLRTFDEFDAAVKQQIAHIVRLSAIGTVISQRVHRDVAPKPLMSLLVEGCMESGKDVAAGGAMVNHGPGLIFSGLATYVDSMAAIRKLVFEEKKYTLEQIRDALLANFEGYEALRRDCLNAPKYGNDDNYVDQYALDITEWTEKECRKYKMLYSTLSHGTLSISNNTPIGELTNATPNGRLAWMPLSDGISPTQGADKQGPTAIIKSVSKMNVETMNIGMVHNFKFLKGLLDTPEGRHGLITLLRTASILGNGQMQFSYVDNEVLKKAQQEPEKYRDLIVRVAGYSAYFVELCKEVQDEIISRTVIEKF